MIKNARRVPAPEAERGALWSPDGSSIVFDAHRDGGRAIYEKRANSALPEKLLLATGAHNVAVTDWSAVRVSQAPAAFQWDVARDGQRLLRTSGVAERTEGSFPITVILNWSALIED